MAATLCGAVLRHPLNESKFRKIPFIALRIKRHQAVRLTQRLGSDDEIRQQPLREPSDSYWTPLRTVSSAQPGATPTAEDRCQSRCQNLSGRNSQKAR